MTLRAEEVITGFRVHKMKTAAMFAAMDTSVEELKETVREASGVDTAKYGLLHTVKWANIHNAWLSVKVNQEVKSKVDAVARAHGQPIQYLTADWASMIFQFKQQHGMSIHDESCLHRVISSRSKSVSKPKAHVVSLEEERVQIGSKPELSTQMGMHLASRKGTSPVCLRIRNHYVRNTG